MRNYGLVVVQPFQLNCSSELENNRWSFMRSGRASWDGTLSHSLLWCGPDPRSGSRHDSCIR